MPPTKVCTVVASRPRVMLESLRAALIGTFGIEVVGSAGDGLSTLNLVRERQPDLLVIDCNLLEEEILALLRQVKEEHTHVCCLVLTQSRRQHVMAIDAGADVALSRSCTTRELNIAVTRIRSSLERERGLSIAHENQRN